MKILQIVHGFPPKNIAGTEVYTYNLSSELAKNHETFVFYRGSDCNVPEYQISRKRMGNLNTLCINNSFRLCNSFEDTYRNDQIAEKLNDVLVEIKPDIVHIQHLLYLSANIVKKIKECHIPVIFTLHDYWLICPQGQLLRDNTTLCRGESHHECVNCVLHQISISKPVFSAYFFLRKNAPEPLVQLFRDIYLSYRRLFSSSRTKAARLIEERVQYMHRLCTEVDLFISPSRFLRQKFIDFGIPEERISFIPYGFNLEELKSSQKTPANKLRFGFIGNLLPAKGAHLLISCFNKISNDKVELKIYGQVNSYKGALVGYLKSIKKLAKNSNIKFMGGVDHGKIAEIFKEIDLLVVPSIWYENAPLVIQEAFATRTPVIASRIGGIPELINDGVNGLLFNPGDEADLKNKIQHVIDNPNILKEFGENAPEVKTIKENAQEIERAYGFFTLKRKKFLTI